jgi:hypothetical protein
MDMKGKELSTIKIHIPLFGQFMKYEEMFDRIKKELAQDGIFITTSIQKANDGIIYQINSSDYELLQQMAIFYGPIEKIGKILRYDQSLEAKKQLINFLQTSPDIPEE